MAAHRFLISRNANNILSNVGSMCSTACGIFADLFDPRCSVGRGSWLGME